MNFLSSHIACSSLNLSIKGTFPAYLREVSLSTLLSYPKHLCFFISSPASFNLKERLTFLPIFSLLDNSYSIIPSFFRLSSLFHCVFFLLAFYKNAQEYLVQERTHKHTLKSEKVQLRLDSASSAAFSLTRGSLLHELEPSVLADRVTCGTHQLVSALYCQYFYM